MKYAKHPQKSIYFGEKRHYKKIITFMNIRNHLIRPGENTCPAEVHRINIKIDHGAGRFGV